MVGTLAWDCYLATLLLRIEHQRELLTAKRNVVTDELVRGIKVIKANAWEEYFAQILIDLHNEEGEHWRRYGLLVVTVAPFFAFVVPIVFFYVFVMVCAA